MPKKVTLHQSNETIQLEGTPFAAGGEGELFKIIAPSHYRNYVAKLYFENKRTELQATKIHYLIGNPPELVQQEGHQSIIWMKDSVYENGQFAGFIMPMAEGEKLEMLCTHKIPKKYRQEWKRFSLSDARGRELRLKVCFNIAAAVYQIHKTQKYVLVDLKPDNILLQPNGLISIVDIDSVQVVEKEQLKYPARVATPEFSPPEYYGTAKPGKTIIFETWDRFGLAVIFYKMLFGIHPYAGSTLAPYDTYVTLEDKIKHGLFVYSPTKKSFFSVVPPPHKAFNHLPVHIQNLFIRCFEYGHANVYERPTANEWCWGTTPRPPLINMRQLPSTELPVQVVQYTPAVSLSPINDRIQLPNFNHQPPPAVRKRRLGTDSTFTLIRITSVAMLIFAFFWFFGRSIPFSLLSLWQLGGMSATFLLIGLVDYYSLPIVAEKKQIEQVKMKMAEEKREKRQLVNQLILQAQNIPTAEQDVQAAFYAQQNKILEEERLQIDKIVSRYRQLVSGKDQEVLNLNQAELKAVQAVEARLLEGVDLSALKSINFLPLPDKVIWLEQQLNMPSADTTEATLTQINDWKTQLTPLSADFETQRAAISKDFTEKHNAIKAECEIEYEALLKSVAEINIATQQQKDALFAIMREKYSQNLENSSQTLEEVNKNLVALEDVYQNFNTVSDKLLEYDEITFKQYLKKAAFR